MKLEPIHSQWIYPHHQSMCQPLDPNRSDLRCSSQSRNRYCSSSFSRSHDSSYPNKSPPSRVPVSISSLLAAGPFHLGRSDTIPHVRNQGVISPHSQETCTRAHMDQTHQDLLPIFQLLVHRCLPAAHRHVVVKQEGDSVVGDLWSLGVAARERERGCERARRGSATFPLPS
jgi:hypothetical protein